MKLTVDLFNPQEVETAKAIFELLGEPVETYEEEVIYEEPVEPEPEMEPEMEPEVVAEKPGPVKAKVPGKKEKAPEPAAVDEIPSLNEVKNSVRELVRNGKMTRVDVETLLNTYGVKAVSDMSDEDRADFFVKCNTAAGEVEDVPF